ncbi:hypothetical protein SISSUDRAFT_1056038, partial [Sistotremastrum suecicum HHB10207 ss-3]
MIDRLWTVCLFHASALASLKELEHLFSIVFRGRQFLQYRAEEIIRRGTPHEFSSPTDRADLKKSKIEMCMNLHIKIYRQSGVQSSRRQEN